MHDWLINEIRRLYATVSSAMRDAIESHEQRSYGHYGLTRSISHQPYIATNRISTEPSDAAQPRWVPIFQWSTNPSRRADRQRYLAERIAR